MKLERLYGDLDVPHASYECVVTDRSAEKRLPGRCLESFKDVCCPLQQCFHPELELNLTKARYVACRHGKQGSKI
jgi:hypothetical protein